MAHPGPANSFDRVSVPTHSLFETDAVRTSTGNPPQIYQLNFGADQNGPLKVEAVL
jgi:hypothetical protein